MSSAHRKCPLSGLFGTPPSINFFSPSTADTNIFLIANNTIIDNNSSNGDSNVDDDSDNIDNVVVDNDDSVAVAATAVTTTIVAEEKATICNQFSEEIVSTQQQQQESSQDISKLSQTMDGQLTSFLTNTLKTIDSDVLDCGPFQVGFMEDSDHHMVSPPFEISQYPIEVKESKDAIHRQLTNRCRNSGKLRRHSLQARMESAQHDGDSSLLQINSLGLLNGMDENLELRARSPQHVEMYTFRDAVDVNYQRMAVTGEELSGVPLEDLKESARELTEALMLRKEYMERIGNQFPLTTKNFLAGYYPKNLPKYRRKNIEMTAQTSYNPPLPPEDHWGLNIPLPKYEKTYILKRNRGMVEILDKDEEVPHQFRHAYISKEKFLRDLERLSVMIVNGPLKSFCYRRLCFLQNKFQLHTLMNELREQHEQKSVPHRDFYNIRKVDTHIHAASSMNQKHLLRFIKKKMKTEKDTVVLERNGMKITLEQVFEGLGISAYDLSVDMLDVHADRNTFHRFDKFNTKYNPVGESTLREIFIKTDNYVGGKYFADVLKEVLSDLEDSKYQHAEPRLSIYGHNKEEWDKLAKWAIENDVYSVNARWLIQIPRLYDVYRSKKMQISGIDSVDDESKLEHIKFDRLTPEPKDYCDAENPSYDYYLFYMYANLVALNALRRERGLNTFSLRPHCGEAGHVSHLVTGYLTSESIAHGLLLRKVPVLQYLFYLSQIGIAMSPLSNNSLFISYHRNPLPEFHMKGLNVSLSTDDPLQFHFTKEALMEEYSIAAQVWKLSSCDMCELARNSVLQSGFEDKVKVHWLGPNYKEEGVLGNDISRTNVPDIRVSFRHETLVDELCSLFRTRNIHRIENYNDDDGGLRI
ncbi:Adenosine/AMP deaminase family protein [Brugia pahangi]